MRSADRRWVFAAVSDERRHVADLVDGLGAAELATPSLCSGWDVKTVAAHLVSVVADGFWGFQRAAVLHFGLHRGIDELARRRARLPANEIAAALRHYADRKVSPPINGPRSGLADVLIHCGDIKIPLGLAFEPDTTRAAVALDFLTRGWALAFVPRGRLHQISLCATDVDRTWGKGAEVRGPLAALLMSVAGRTALLDQLDGPGVPLLRSRLARS